MFFHLPPAGNPIIWEPSLTSSADVKKQFKPYDTFFYNSGAESLAAAIVSIISYKGVAVPEVILSAYSCPELVSAILYAGAKPVLVDLERQRSWINMTDLGKKITKNTVAIIAVNLFGIAERLEKISKICNRHEIVLIEDSAQSLPEITDNRFWQGDFIVLSFGRGKPVSVLGGGALLCRNQELIKRLPEGRENGIKSYKPDWVKYRLKIFLYNLLLHPGLYFIPNSLPFLKLGETRFKPLRGIKIMMENNACVLEANIEHYMRTRTDEKQQWLSTIISKSELIDLAKACSSTNNVPALLRYPVLASSRKRRDELYDKLNRAGLGVSKMYQKPLNEIQGLKEMFRDQGEFPNAKEFSETLLTLPTHNGLTLSCVQRMKEYISV